MHDEDIDEEEGEQLAQCKAAFWEAHFEATMQIGGGDWDAWHFLENFKDMYVTQCRRGEMDLDRCEAYVEAARRAACDGFAVIARHS